MKVQKFKCNSLFSHRTIVDCKTTGQLIYSKVVTSFKLYNFLGSDGTILLGKILKLTFFSKNVAESSEENGTLQFTPLVYIIVKRPEIYYIYSVFYFD